MKRVIIALVALAGCTLSPKDYETAPVQVDTPQGLVTCQLYSAEILAWDRSIDRPATMGVQNADEVCQQEGRRQQRASQAI